jgi:hypothetical protein
MKRLLVLTVIILLSHFVQAQEQSIQYSQADRDRMVRVETQVEAMKPQINRLEDKFDSYFM